MNNKYMINLRKTLYYIFKSKHFISTFIKKKLNPNLLKMNASNELSN